MEVIKKKMATMKKKLEDAENEANKAEEELNNCLKKTEEVRLYNSENNIKQFSHKNFSAYAIIS